ncbi:MAG TPA: glycosyltransferase family 4 protein [Syntrophomonadaceae bacterium]|nr:glycosyltransferase family 4 protein [Syntrophomonadaceae bacterium]
MAYKVLHVVRPAQGGIKRHLEVIFSGLNRERYLLYLAAPPDSELFTSLRPFAQKVFPVSIGEGWHPFRDWNILVHLRRIIRDEKIDLVHTHGVRAGILGQMAALAAGNPCVVATIHNSQNPGERFFIFFRLVQGFLNRTAANHIITVSKALKDEVRSYQWTPAHKITVIYNGINPDDYKCRPLLPFSTLGLSGDLPVVGTVARLEPKKGIRYLIEAVPLIEREYGPVNCVIIGDGPERSALEELVRRMKLTERIKFLGFQKDIPQLIRLFDVVAVPSIQEGLSIFCLEALASARPVVASAVGGIPEIIKDGRTGILVPPADPEALAHGVLTLLRDRELAQKLATQGRQLVSSEFSEYQMLRKTEEIYEKVLSGTCGGGDA